MTSETHNGQAQVVEPSDIASRESEGGHKTTEHGSSSAHTPRRVTKLLERARYTGPAVSPDSLIGVDSCLRQLRHQIKLLERPDLFERMGLEPSGTLFIGPPGTGKTLMARLLAGQLDMPLYQLSADEFESEPRLVHDVFRALGNERALLFIDEISIIAQNRRSSGRREMLSALLTSLDALSSYEIGSRLWVIGACTPDIDLDPAIYRSGRLGVVVEFAAPSEEQRAALFRLCAACRIRSTMPASRGWPRYRRERLGPTSTTGSTRRHPRRSPMTNPTSP
jgi:transitional endoplasmic reticulum ATPase